jgi:glycosyltransferase involved in cell wall biosynthesis
VSGVLLVPDLALERWPSMDRYAAELARRVPGLQRPEEARTLRGGRYWMRYVTYPRALRRYRPDLVHVADHSYAHCLAAFPGVPSVVTIHDLFPLHVLATAGRSVRSILRDALLRRVLAWVNRAGLWICGSEFTAGEARRHLELPPERIRVVPYGVDERFATPPAKAGVAERRSGWLGADAGPRSYVVLHVGNCSGRKNVEAAIAALGVLRKGGLDARLVQIGGRFARSHQRAMAASGVEGYVRQETQVTEEALIDAYYAADVMVLPSTYEGFGLPALEALAAGLPVVTSGAGGLAEAVGEAALITTSEPAALAESMARALTDDATRTTLIQRGLLHARTMTWDRTAAATQGVYAELLPALRTLHPTP